MASKSEKNSEKMSLGKLAEGSKNVDCTIYKDVA